MKEHRKVVWNSRTTALVCLSLLVVLGFGTQLQSAAQAQQRDRGPSPYVEENNQIRRDKFDVVLPQVMRENNVDMWIHVMREAIPVVEAAWPPSILDIRRDIQIFRDSPGAPATVVATFAYEDGLTTGAAPAQAYSVFLLGEDRGTGYESGFVTYRRVSDQGKGVPRFFDHLDWDRDGSSEVVLEVLGESNIWVSGLDRGPDGWTEVYHDPCGLPSPNALHTP